MIEPLSNQRLYELLASYGAHPDRWPIGERAGAIRCLIDSAEARQAWRDADALDRALDLVPGDVASPALAERITALAGTPRQHGPNSAVVAARHIIPYAAAAAIALMIGLAVPSPLRDAPIPAPVVATVAPTTQAESAAPSSTLSALALIDQRSLADEDVTASGDLGGDTLLADLPLL